MKSRFLSSECGGAFFNTLFFSVVVAVICFIAPSRSIGLLSSFLTVDNAPVPAQAIVVLLGGDGPERVLKAHELYAQGFSKRIVFGTGFQDKQTLASTPPGFQWPVSSARYVAAFKSLDVPRSSLLLVDTSDAYDTAHELEAIAEHLRKMNLTLVLLVTSESHTRRVDLIWQRVAPDIEHYTVSAPQPGFQTWWKSGKNRRTLAYEYGALLKEGLTRIHAGLTSTRNDSQSESGEPSAES